MTDSELVKNAVRINGEASAKYRDTSSRVTGLIAELDRCRRAIDELVSRIESKKQDISRRENYIYQAQRKIEDYQSELDRLRNTDVEDEDDANYVRREADNCRAGIEEELRRIRNWETEIKSLQSEISQMKSRIGELENEGTRYAFSLRSYAGKCRQVSGSMETVGRGVDRVASRIENEAVPAFHRAAGSRFGSAGRSAAARSGARAGEVHGIGREAQNIGRQFSSLASSAEASADSFAIGAARG